MAHPLDGIWEKIRRADEHIRSLNAEITSLLNSNAYSIVGESKADTQEHVLRVVGPNPPLKLSVIAGEIIHQCRSALDHLIGQLVLANKGTPDYRHEFPICETPNKFKEACERKKLRGISVTAEATVHALQPYHNPKGFQWHPLWVLHTMDITDKHRLLMVVAASASLGNFLEIDGGQPSVSIVGLSEPKWPARPTKEGTEIFSIKLTEHAPNMKVSVKPTIEIVFEKYGPLPDQPVIHCINELRNAAVGTIQRFIAELRPMRDALGAGKQEHSA